MFYALTSLHPYVVARLCCRLNKYRWSSGYNSLDLRCFEVTNAFHKNIKDNNIEAVKLDYSDQELQ